MLLTALFALSVMSDEGVDAQSRTTIRDRQTTVISKTSQLHGIVQDCQTEVSHAADQAVVTQGPAPHFAALVKMAQVDQVARTGLLRVMADRSLSPDVRRASLGIIATRMNKLDAAHADYLLSVAPPDWFRASRDGEEAARAAWLIVQHSQRPELMQRVLQLMEASKGTSDFNAGNYAKLYDRVHANGGAAQRFATQATCSNESGRWIFQAPVDLAEAARMRKSIGWNETIAETRTRLRIDLSCK